MKNKLNLVLLILVIILAAGLAGAGYVAFDKAKVASETDKKLKETQSNPTQANQEKAQATVDKLKKVLFVEEDGKQPAVATIVDPDKVKESNQEFYKNVQKDDVLIVYPYRAIIFRESQNQIINVAPIINPSNTEGTTPKSDNATSIEETTLVDKK